MQASTVCFGDWMFDGGRSSCGSSNGFRRPKTRQARCYAELACVSENGILAKKPVNMSFAVQLAKHDGAHVTAVCGTSNVELVRSLTS